MRSHQRSLAALYTGAGGLIAGAVGMFLVPKQYCTFQRYLPDRQVRAPPWTESCTYGTLNYGIGIAGSGLALLGAVTYFLLRPTMGELVDGVNAYNAEGIFTPFHLPSAPRPTNDVEPYH